MSLSILTANTAFGLTHMDSLWPNLRNHTYIHTWRVIPFMVSGTLLSPLIDFTTPPPQTNLAKLKRLSSLDNTIKLIQNTNPDVVVLNELIYQLHKEVTEAALRKLGFNSFTWGFADHHTDVTIATLVAAKHAGEEILVEFPQAPHMGGGGGCAALRLRDHDITILGVHMCNNMPKLWDEQIEVVKAFIEQHPNTIVAGDLNKDTGTVLEYINLKTVNTENLPTAPTCMPRIFQKPIDHVLIPQSWHICKNQTLDFKSDHHAIYSEFQY